MGEADTIVHGDGVGGTGKGEATSDKRGCGLDGGTRIEEKQDCHVCLGSATSLKLFIKVNSSIMIWTSHVFQLRAFRGLALKGGE